MALKRARIATLGIIILASTNVIAQNVPVSFSYKRGNLPVHSPANDKITKVIFPQPTAMPNYNYNYVVEDPRSGDRKSQQETRHGDVVKGSYSFIEADGTRRIVEYTADPASGFNAVVRREIPEEYSAPAPDVSYTI